MKFLFALFLTFYVLSSYAGLSSSSLLPRMKSPVLAPPVLVPSVPMIHPTQKKQITLEKDAIINKAMHKNLMFLGEEERVQAYVTVILSTLIKDLEEENAELIPNTHILEIHFYELPINSHIILLIAKYFPNLKKLLIGEYDNMTI
jgi:hypothetical protein